MITKIKEITPLYAKQLLANNTNNRKVNARRVESYAEIMRQGKWQLTHQGIAICDDDTIIDGQHRLLAIIKANKTIPFNISYNVSKDVQKYIDVGYKRTVSNVFQMNGIIDANQQAAGIVKYFKLSVGKYGSDSFSSNSVSITNALTHDDYLKFYYENQDDLIWVLRFSRRIYDQYRFFSSSQIYGFALFCYLDKNHPKEIIESFFQELYMIVPYSGRSTLIKYFLKALIKDATGTKDLKSSAKSAMLIKAYNAYMLKKDGKQIKFTASKESFPTIIDREKIKL